MQIYKKRLYIDGEMRIINCLLRTPDAISYLGMSDEGIAYHTKQGNLSPVKAGRTLIKKLGLKYNATMIPIGQMNLVKCGDWKSREEKQKWYLEQELINDND